MNKKEIILKVLTDMGYCPTVDNDNDVVFNYQLKTIYFSIINDDEPDQNMVLGNFYTFEESEAVQMLIVCNKINREIRHIKVAVNPDLKAVSAFYQFVLTDEESARANIKVAFDLFGTLRSYFAQEVDRLSENNETESDNKSDEEANE